MRPCLNPKENFSIVVFDTETTGLNPSLGHRIVDFAALQLIWNAGQQCFVLGEAVQFYVNPERSSDPEAQRVHQLSSAFLSEQEPFSEYVVPLAQWFHSRGNNVWLLAHNAKFDIRFLNSELSNIGLKQTFPELSNASGVIDSVQFFRYIAPNNRGFNLNAFCRWAGVRIGSRTVKHGAMVDCKLLANSIINAHSKVGIDLFFAALQHSSLDDDRLLQTKSRSKKRQILKRRGLTTKIDFTNLFLTAFQKTTPVPSKSLHPVNKWTYVTLALLLGGLGVHKFYAKRMAEGVVYLVFTATFIPWIVAIVEGIVAAGKKPFSRGQIFV